MSTEIELKLDLPSMAADKLADHPLLAGLTTQTLELQNTYYDTSALELHARRIAVRFRKKGEQWLCTVKTAEPASGGLAMRSEWEIAARPGHFAFDHVDHPELYSFLESRREALEPVFTTNFRRQAWQVPFGNSLIELALDRGTIESRGRHAKICEIELELLSGQISDLFALTRRLQDDDLDLHPAVASKAERGYNLFLDQPLKPFVAPPAPISADMTPVAAFRVIALNCLEHFQRNEAGLPAGDAPAFLHQARLALRRLRWAIKLFAPVLPKNFVSTYGRAWQTLAEAIGKTSGSKPAAHEYGNLLLEFTASLFTLHAPQADCLENFAGRQVAEHAQRAHKLAKRHRVPISALRHRRRRTFKKLRYALELFSPLLTDDSLANYRKVLLRLQQAPMTISDQSVATKRFIVRPPAAG